MKITNDEYNFLMLLSSRTKMDCWFTIETDLDGNDFVFDLENSEPLPLHEGIGMLFEGVINEDIENFNTVEHTLWNSICEKVIEEYQKCDQE